MKDLSLFNKIVFFFNNVCALLFIASFAIPYIAPKTFPLIAIISLLVPFLLSAHLAFILYWIFVGFKKQVFLSVFCILLSIIFSAFPYEFNKKVISSNDELSLMTYNVHLFNKYNWINKDNIATNIMDFIHKNDPDILVFQEYSPSAKVSFNYPYKAVVLKGEKINFGQAIYSKHKIISKGSVDFENSSNNAIYVDILKNKDTIRIYNIHLESLRLGNNQELLIEEESEKIIKRLTKAFVKQQGQVEKFLLHKAQFKGKTIICGDLNNTAYSWAYHQIKNQMNDTFIEAGTGFGKTFDFRKYPLRIDFILVDKSLEVNEHQNFTEIYSDHFPVMARIGL